MAPLVSVVTAVRNGMPFLEQTVESVRGQSVEDWEYLIVDDGSEDGTREWVRAATLRDMRIRPVLRNEQGGPFVAANQAIVQARGKYIVRIDADDLQPPNRIERQLEFLHTGSGQRACVSPWLSFDETGVRRRSGGGVPSRTGVARWYLILSPFASHSSLCIERDALEAVGLYDEFQAAADFALVAKLFRLGWIGVIPEVLSFVRRHAGRISRRMGAVQREVTLGVLEEYVMAMTGRTWSRKTIADLLDVGQGRCGSMAQGWEAIRGWGELWRSKVSSRSLDWTHLRRLEGMHHWRIWRARLTQEPGSAVRVGLRIVLKYGLLCTATSGPRPNRRLAERWIAAAGNVKGTIGQCS